MNKNSSWSFWEGKRVHHLYILPVIQNTIIEQVLLALTVSKCVWL